MRSQTTERACVGACRAHASPALLRQACGGGARLAMIIATVRAACASRGAERARAVSARLAGLTWYVSPRVKTEPVPAPELLNAPAVRSRRSITGLLTRWCCGLPGRARQRSGAPTTVAPPSSAIRTTAASPIKAVLQRRHLQLQRQPHTAAVSFIKAVLQGGLLLPLQRRPQRAARGAGANVCKFLSYLAPLRISGSCLGEHESNRPSTLGGTRPICTSR